MNWGDIFAQSQRDFPLVFPEVMLAFFGLAILLTDFLLGPRQKGWNSLTAMLGVGLSAASLYVIMPAASAGHGPTPAQR